MIAARRIAWLCCAATLLGSGSRAVAVGSGGAAIALGSGALLAIGAGPAFAKATAGRPVWAGQAPVTPAAKAPLKPATPATPANKAAAPATPAAFDRLVEQATAARTAEQWDEAIALYAKAVKLKPSYVEGYWYQGTAYYTLEKFAECREQFRTVARLAPKNGAAQAFLGLCEFALKDYDRSLQHLLQSRILGVGETPDLGSVARYHAAVLMTRVEQYEQALETLGEFASEGDDSPRVIEAMGIATLRMAMLPSEVPPDRRERILMAGRASFLMATRNTAGAARAFDALVSRYSDAPNVHYANAVFLLGEQPDRAIEEFTRELEIQPGHPWSLMQIAYEYLKRGDGATALPWAKQAVAAAPNAFPARKALGQALLENGDVEGAIGELLTGIKLAPQSPGLHFQLARAYQRAGRLEDATRERDEFTRLDRLARTQRTGAQSVGGR
jgi:tetratricopeptide (TPR) repeat protein